MNTINNRFSPYDLSRILATSTTAYLADLENRTLKPVFTVSKDDRIGGFAEPTGEWEKTTWQSVLVVTRNSVNSLDMDGRTEWVVPYQPSYPAYNRIDVLFLEPTNRFAVEFIPDYLADNNSGWKLPTRIEWLTGREGISKSLDLPSLLHREGNNIEEKLTGWLMPPAFPIYFGDHDDRTRAAEPLCPAILCAIVGWRLGRRATAFAAKAQVGWGVFHLVFGLPGLLAFLSVQEWPARESCPNCKKLRVVDREKCPHCGADFAPPERMALGNFRASWLNINSRLFVPE